MLHTSLDSRYMMLVKGDLKFNFLLNKIMSWLDVLELECLIVLFRYGLCDKTVAFQAIAKDRILRL